MKYACQYALVHFMPFVETGEFANVGAVLLCPEARFFGFKLLKRYGRVTKFFHQLDARIYREAKQAFCDELARVNDLLKREALDGRRTQVDIKAARLLFTELTRTREVMFRFDAPRVVLADDPKATLNQLYEFYVERDFATKEYQERLLERNLRRFLFAEQMGERFHEAKVGDANFHVRFPFVHLVNERPTRVIKPLHLAQAEPNKILNHGGPWVDKVRRLKRHGNLPANVLFAVDGPTANQGKRMAAFEEICGDLREQGVQVTPITARQDILAFAQA